MALHSSRDELDGSDWSAMLGDGVCLPDDTTFASTYFFLALIVSSILPRTPLAVIWLACPVIIYHA